jgi:hypothetical protein
VSGESGNRDALDLPQTEGRAEADEAPRLDLPASDGVGGGCLSLVL